MSCVSRGRSEHRLRQAIAWTPAGRVAPSSRQRRHG